MSFSPGTCFCNVSTHSCFGVQGTLQGEWPKANFVANEPWYTGRLRVSWHLYKCRTTCVTVNATSSFRKPLQNPAMKNLNSRGRCRSDSLLKPFSRWVAQVPTWVVWDGGMVTIYCFGEAYLHHYVPCAVASQMVQRDRQHDISYGVKFDKQRPKVLHVHESLVYQSLWVKIIIRATKEDDTTVYGNNISLSNKARDKRQYRWHGLSTKATSSTHHDEEKTYLVMLACKHLQLHVQTFISPPHKPAMKKTRKVFTTTITTTAKARKRTHVQIRRIAQDINKTSATKGIVRKWLHQYITRFIFVAVIMQHHRALMCLVLDPSDLSSRGECSLGCGNYWAPYSYLTKRSQSRKDKRGKDKRQDRTGEHSIKEDDRREARNEVKWREEKKKGKKRKE